MRWSECKSRKIVKEVGVDKKLVLALVGISKNRLSADKFVPLNNSTASIKVANNYDSMREILEAVAISKGLKIYSHDCFTGFISEVLRMDKEANDFDKFRKIRNAINYYGKGVAVEDAEVMIKGIVKLRSKLLGLLR